MAGIMNKASLHIDQKVAGERPYLSVIIPVYNEEKRIGDSLEKIIAFLGEKDYSWEIVVVDDGCKDRTLEIAGEKVPAEHLNILINERNMGKGATIRNGMINARGELRLFSDADLSTPIEELDKLAAPVKEGYDVTFGSRAMKESKLEVRQPWHRELMGRIFNLIVQILHLPGVKDTQCGFKLFTRKAAEDIFPRQKMPGFAFDVEILVIAKKLGYKMKEVPVRWIDSPASKVSPVKDAIKMFLDLVKLKLRRIK